MDRLECLAEMRLTFSEDSVREWNGGWESPSLGFLNHRVWKVGIRIERWRPCGGVETCVCEDAFEAVLF